MCASLRACLFFTRGIDCRSHLVGSRYTDSLTRKSTEKVVGQRVKRTIPKSVVRHLSFSVSTRRDILKPGSDIHQQNLVYKIPLNDTSVSLTLYEGSFRSSFMLL